MESRPTAAGGGGRRLWKAALRGSKVGEEMGEDWLEIPDERIDAAEVVERVRARIARRGVASSSEGPESPADVAEAVWQEMIGDTAGPSASSDGVPIRQGDCDVVPRQYVIDWRMPILGPIHALVRRIINVEVRRYVLPSLDKQSHLNRRFLRIVDRLSEENERLRREIEELRETQR